MRRKINANEKEKNIFDLSIKRTILWITNFPYNSLQSNKTVKY